MSLQGEVIKIWNSAKIAADTLNINIYTLSRTCHKNKQLEVPQYQTGGFIWSYPHDDIINEEWEWVVYDIYCIKVSNNGRIEYKTGKRTYGTLHGRYRTVNIGKNK